MPASAEASVIEAEGRRFGRSWNASVRCNVRVLVEPEGQPPFESECHTWGTIFAGARTYVRWNPAHPERCEIDHARLDEVNGPGSDRAFFAIDALRGD